jgi:hypothetical protein
MKSFRFLICATLICGSLTLFAGCRNKSNQNNQSNPEPSSMKPDTTKVKPAGSDTSKVKTVSFAGDEPGLKGSYLFLWESKAC